ncbi:MAG: NACHT domain-containing protein [Actinomycetota bacterium]
MFRGSLNDYRNRPEDKKIPIIALFPEKATNFEEFSRVEAVENWSDLLRKRQELTKDWDGEVSLSITPIESYRDHQHLKELVLEKLRKVFPSLLIKRGSIDKNKQLLSLQYEHHSDKFDLENITSVFEYDSHAVQQYRTLMRESKLSIYPQDLSDREFLRRSGYLKDGRLTIAGVLLFSSSPSDTLSSDLSSAITRCAAYDGITRASERDRDSFEGPLLSQLFRARDFIAKHIKVREKVTTSSMQAGQEYQYPMRCVREIIANALCHRDYSDKERASYVRIYTNRIEVCDPGRWIRPNVQLAEGKTVFLRELEGSPVERKMRLARAISDVGVMEMEGSGIPTAVQDCEESSAEVPSVVEKDGYVVVTIYPRRNWDDTTLDRYLQYVISRNRYWKLQGTSSGARLVNIELERLYVTLKATRALHAQEGWLTQERRLAPGEWQKLPEAVTVQVQEALAEHPRLVVLGNPGSGKTTLLRYLALCYARERAEGSSLVHDRLGLSESGFLPVLLPLRNLGAYLKAHYPAADGTEGHGRLLTFVHAYLQGERITMPDDFFDADLNGGRVVLLFDGMDEVSDFELRRRVARLVDAFAMAYPKCRMIVTSRIAGYTGSARLGEDFVTTTIQDFTLADVEQFLTYWHRMVAIGQMGPGESAEHYAAMQTRRLVETIDSNPQVRELAIKPLMLTVIALVHRDRVMLPERRAELYAELVDVLLGKWDEARGVEDIRILDDRRFDTVDRRLVVQFLALMMHTNGQTEVKVEYLLLWLMAAFENMTPDVRAAERAAERFLTVIQERTGLLVEAEQRVYRFSHLTFQDYLAAVEIAEREDYIQYTLSRTADPFWREVILLEAGYLSTKNQTRTTRLIRAIADSPTEPEPLHNLKLAAECIRDVGATRVDGDFATVVAERLRERE